EARFDMDGSAERPREGSPRGRALEAREPPVRVDAPAGVARSRPDELALARHEAKQLRLRSLPSAAGAGPLRHVRQALAPPSASATAVAGGPWVAAASAGAADSVSTSSSGSDCAGATGAASSDSCSASASSSGSDSSTTGCPPASSALASAWCAETPQYFEPG